MDRIITENGITVLPSMEGSFLHPESILSDEWSKIGSCVSMKLILTEPSSAAMALKVWPEAVSNIKIIVYAGGTLARGDATAYAEKSVHRDPHGMESLLNCGAPVVFALKETAEKLGMTAEELAADYAADPGNYETAACGIHAEISKDAKTFGKLICDINADKKFEKKNASVILNRK